MSADGALPLNIKDALDSELGYVLVVAGNPGTGKSLFVQEVMREYPSSFLILTNSENIPNSMKDLASDIQDWDKRHALALYWREVSDANNPEFTLKKQISLLLGSESDRLESDIIIIDSWSDFIQPIPLEKRYQIQQSLMYAARNENKKLILVTEIDSEVISSHQLSHSADAIIYLQKLRTDQRMYRQLVIEKMRSRPLAQDTYLFTLAKGRFTYIPWYIHQYPAITVEREPLTDPSESMISTGNKSLDGLLHGGFVKGSMSLIEVENLAAPYLETIYIPFLSNHLQLGRPAIIILPEGWSPERFTDGLSHFVDREVVNKQVVFFGRQALGKDINVRSIDNDPWKTLQEIRYESSQLERKFQREVTELFALDTLENRYGPATVKGMIAEVSAALPGTERAAITILSRQQAITSGSVSPSMHLRVQEINGVLSVCGVNPRTSFLAVRPILSAGFLDYELLPIV